MCTNEKNDKNKIGLISKKTFILLSTERRGKSESSNNQEKSSYTCTRKSTRKKLGIFRITHEKCVKLLTFASEVISRCACDDS